MKLRSTDIHWHPLVGSSIHWHPLKMTANQFYASTFGDPSTIPDHCVARSSSGPGAAGNQWVLQTQSTLLLVILSIIILLVQCLASPSPLSELWLVTWPQRWALIGRLTPYCVLCGDWARITAQTSAAHRLITRSHFLLTRDREQNVDLIPPGYPSLQCGEEAGLCSDQWAEPASTRQPISTGTQ